MTEKIDMPQPFRRGYAGQFEPPMAVLVSRRRLSKRQKNALMASEHHPGCFPDGDDTTACHPGCQVRAAKERTDERWTMTEKPCEHVYVLGNRAIVAGREVTMVPTCYYCVRCNKTLFEVTGIMGPSILQAPMLTRPEENDD